MTTDYDRIERAIHFLETNFRRQPELPEIARSVYLSPYHFQRLFRRWAGVTPKQFLGFLTAEHAKRALRDSRSVMDAAYDSGLSGGGRLHDLLVTLEGVTPGEFKRQGAGMEIVYGVHPTPFGHCLLAATARGICSMAFLEGEGGATDTAVEELALRWPAARLREESATTGDLLERVFGGAGGSRPLRLRVGGTNFQIRVWEALLRIPVGCRVSYRDIAVRIGAPGAARAVGSAVARNPVAVLIPCHRVVRQAGGIGEYRWGSARKRALLAWEAARVDAFPGEAVHA